MTNTNLSVPSDTGDYLVDRWIAVVQGKVVSDGSRNDCTAAMMREFLLSEELAFERFTENNKESIDADAALARLHKRLGWVDTKPAEPAKSNEPSWSQRLVGLWDSLSNALPMRFAMPGAVVASAAAVILTMHLGTVPDWPITEGAPPTFKSIAVPVELKPMSRSTLNALAKELNRENIRLQIYRQSGVYTIDLAVPPGKLAFVQSQLLKQVLLQTPEGIERLGESSQIRLRARADSEK